MRRPDTALWEARQRRLQWQPRDSLYLISAAKQTGVPFDAARLRWAVTSSARYLSGYGAYEQGSGLFQIGSAWEVLRADSRRRLKSPESCADPNRRQQMFERTRSRSWDLRTRRLDCRTSRQTHHHLYRERAAANANHLLASLAGKRRHLLLPEDFGPAVRKAGRSYRRY